MEAIAWFSSPVAPWVTLLAVVVLGAVWKLPKNRTRKKRLAGVALFLLVFPLIWVATYLLVFEKEHEYFAAEGQSLSALQDLLPPHFQTQMHDTWIDDYETAASSECLTFWLYGIHPLDVVVGSDGNIEIVFPRYE